MVKTSGIMLVGIGATRCCAKGGRFSRRGEGVFVSLCCRQSYCKHWHSIYWVVRYGIRSQWVVR